jgi:hypothetical protein
MHGRLLSIFNPWWPHFAGDGVLAANRGEVAMKALETFAIYVAPFLILGLLTKLLLRRYVVDLTDVQQRAGPKHRPRRVLLLGGWRTED